MTMCSFARRNKHAEEGSILLFSYVFCDAAYIYKLLFKVKNKHFCIINMYRTVEIVILIMVQYWHMLVLIDATGSKLKGLHNPKNCFTRETMETRIEHLVRPPCLCNRSYQIK